MTLRVHGSINVGFGCNAFSDAGSVTPLPLDMKP